MSCPIILQYTYETIDTFAIFKNVTNSKRIDGASTFAKQ